MPNTSAQALKQKNRENVPHHSIACVYARAQDAQNDAFFSTLTRSIEQEALKEGYIVKYSFSTFDIHNPATQNQIINNKKKKTKKTKLPFLAVVTKRLSNL